MASVPSGHRTLGRSNSIQALRGLASLAVAWYHLTGEYDSIAKQFGSLGWLGVEVFFVISGFVIPLSIWNSGQTYTLGKFPGFMAKRIVRIEPPYLASVVMVIVLWEVTEHIPGYAGKPYVFDLVGVLAHIAYLVPLTGSEWLQPVYWTLAWEFVFYLFAGLCFRFISGKMIFWWGLLIGLIVAVLNGLPSVSLLFVIGIATFRGMTGIDRWYSAVAAMALAAGAMCYVGNAAHAAVGAGTAMFIYLLYDFQLKGKLGRALIWIGTVSYSLYLVHVPIGGRVVNLGRRFVPDFWADELMLSVSALAVSLVAAALFYRLVEAPSIRASRALTGLRSGKSAMAQCGAGGAT